MVRQAWRSRVGLGEEVISGLNMVSGDTGRSLRTGSAAIEGKGKA